MSIQSLSASLELLSTTPNARLSYNAPSRMVYHQIAQDVMLIQGIHYAVEEALANIGELVSSDPLLDPRRRCLLRLQRNLTDIARISENVQERMLRNITNHASTSQASIFAEGDLVPKPITKSCGSVPLPNSPIPAPPTSIEGSGEAVVSQPESLPDRSGSEPVAPSSSENPVPLYQAVLERRSKRKASDEDDIHLPKSPAKRPRRDPDGSIYLRPTYRQLEEETSALGWARWMFSRSKQ